MVIAISVFALFATSFGATKTGHKTSTAKSSTTKSSAKSTASKSSKGASSKSKTAKGKRRPRGQQSIDPDRTREIQEALIREHYLDGEATGKMDERTKDALTRYQNDNGWQSKIVPDSRALIKLGLGPSREGLLNPESADIAGPKALSPEKEIPGGH